MNKVIYPGTFDPVTYGHIDVIKRATELFDFVAVTVAVNPGKKPLFTTKERVKILNILLAQAAISLDNALLYESLKKEITVRKNAEGKLLHLATALEQAAEGIMITELDGTINYTNPACEEIFGYSREEIKGQNTRVLRSGSQGDNFFQTMWKTISSGDVWSGPMSSKMKDGSIRELEVTVSPIKDDEGNVISFVSVARDVTLEIQIEK